MVYLSYWIYCFSYNAQEQKYSFRTLFRRVQRQSSFCTWATRFYLSSTWRYCSILVYVAYIALVLKFSESEKYTKGGICEVILKYCSVLPLIMLCRGIVHTCARECRDGFCRYFQNLKVRLYEKTLEDKKTSTREKKGKTSKQLHYNQTLTKIYICIRIQNIQIIINLYINAIYENK